MHPPVSLPRARPRRSLIAAIALCAATLANAQPRDPAQPPATAASKPAPPHKLDRSGRARVGKASFYAHKFAGRLMADGTPMDPHDDNAASKTLPLGTKAKEMALVMEAQQLAERDIPDYVSPDGNAKVTFTRVPTLDEVPYPVKMEPNLVVEFYSR